VCHQVLSDYIRVKIIIDGYSTTGKLLFRQRECLTMIWMRRRPVEMMLKVPMAQVAGTAALTSLYETNGTENLLID
jgi:hypothetical protein